MAGQAAGGSSAAELRNAILLRLLVAALALAAVAIGLNALGPGESEMPAAGPLQAPRESQAPPAATASATAALGELPAAPAQPHREPQAPPAAAVTAAISEAPAAAPPRSEDAAPSAADGEKKPGADALRDPPSSTAHSEGIIRTLRSPETEADHAAKGASGPHEPRPAPKLPSGPYLQVGVFNHPANAAELKARLEAQGIPVFIATRVQVGPFKNRKEAEAMREKLKAMGMASVLINQ